MKRSVFLVGVTILFVTGAVNLQAPLYGVYAERAGVGHGVKSLAFAAYVLGLIPVLVLLGGVSDRIGRKQCLLMGVALSCAATLSVTLFPGLPALVPARVLQGMAVGLTVGTGTAYISDLLGDQPARAARIAAPMSALGFGGGALMTTFALIANRSLVPVTYPIMIVAIATVGVAVGVLCPWLPAQGGALLRLPLIRRDMLSSGLAIGTAWAVSGLVVAVIPAQLARYDLALWSGPVLFLVNAAGVAVQPFVRRMTSRRALCTGLVVVPIGYALLVVGAAQRSIVAALLGACVAGTGCYGFTYLGGLSRVSESAGGQKARAIAGYFLCAYVGFGLPSVVVGYAADGVGLAPALGAFGVVLLAACFAVGLLLAQERPAAVKVAVGRVAR
jgi:hypothetical protein